MAGSVAAERHLWLNLRGEPFSPLWGEVRPQKRFCPLQTCSPHSKPSQPPLGAWQRDEFILIYSRSGSWGRVCLSPATVPSFRRRRAACVGTQSILPCSVRTPCWPPVSPALHTPSTRTRTPRALLRGGGLPLLMIRSGYTFQFGEYPPASTGFNWR